ncbi:Acid phosphatase [Lachnellula hyalina]|uniref:Acid phosphatase n=1 Tax=Lachnellula hyalina TaxID=1316788 RepID=A0A8H8TUF3_9HELO|nr:Acid phosphatase [Lachnellula hyalina]TVY22227.1 Acid phosphatase [Lachnellula hyalina]
MRFFRPSFFIGASASVYTAVNGLNILISNDDGFGTANIRERYKAMKAFGHNVYIVASVTNQSGMGGISTYTKDRNLTSDSEFGIVKKGANSIGTDPNDSHIWYFNGTPSSCVQVALDYVLPRYTNLTTFDLVLSGPNYGWNLGPFLYTLAGTLGATYTAVERGIPAIGISGGYSVQTPYYDVNTTTKAGLKDPATIMAQLSANLAQQLINSIAAQGGGPLLPLGYGINLNIPYITSFTNDSCVNPPFIQTRMTGGADVDYAAFNETTGLFSYQNLVEPGTNQCINGDCSLLSAVSVFTVDYDAPIGGACKSGPDVRSWLAPLVQYANSTNLVGGLNGTSTANATVSTAPVPSASISAIASSGGLKISASGAALMMGFAAIMLI